MAKILLAEDDDSLSVLLKKQLKKAGHKVTLAKNGREAYGFLTQNQYDLLLTDYAMPEMNGIELAKKAQELKRDLRIMFITGFAAVSLEKCKEELLQEPQIISKPFHLKQLTEEIKKLLAQPLDEEPKE